MINDAGGLVKKTKSKTRKAIVLPCKACGEALPLNAKLCAKCGTYQNRWKSRLQFAVTVLGLASALGAAFAYIIPRFPELRRLVAWRTDVRVIRFNSAAGVTAFNAGDGPVFLSHITFMVPAIGSKTLPINLRLEPSQMASDVPHVGIADTGASILINHASPEEWTRAVKVAQLSGSTTCITAVVYSETDPSYQLFVDSDRRDPHVMPQLSASAALHYYDLKTGPGMVDIPVRGLLFRHHDCMHPSLAPPSPK